MSRERDPVPAAEEFKAFVGGISWQINDRELKDSAPPPAGPQQQLESICCALDTPSSGRETVPIWSP